MSRILLAPLVGLIGATLLSTSSFAAIGTCEANFVFGQMASVNKAAPILGAYQLVREREGSSQFVLSAHPGYKKAVEVMAAEQLRGIQTLNTDPNLKIVTLDSSMLQQLKTKEAGSELREVILASVGKVVAGIIQKQTRTMNRTELPATLIDGSRLNVRNAEADIIPIKSFRLTATPFAGLVLNAEAKPRPGYPNGPADIILQVQDSTSRIQSIVITGDQAESQLLFLRILE